MTLRRLRYFVTVADELSFTIAARKLHMAQPPLSTQIRELERELGAELFDRGHRSTVLTAAGRALLPQAHRLLGQYDLMAGVAQRAADGKIGRLSIGMIPSAANGRLPEVLRGFRIARPDVELSLVEERPPELMRWLGAGQIDVALQYSLPSDERFVGRQIASEALLVALPSGHRLARRSRIPVPALASQPLILPAQHGGEGLFERIIRLLAEHEVTPSVVQGDIWMMQTVVGLVSAGIGLAVVPQSAAVIRGGEVEYRSLVGGGGSGASAIEPVPLIAVWRRDDESATVLRFLEHWAALSKR